MKKLYENYLFDLRIQPPFFKEDKRVRLFVDRHELEEEIRPIDVVDNPDVLSLVKLANPYKTATGSDHEKAIMKDRETVFRRISESLTRAIMDQFDFGDTVNGYPKD